MITFTQRHPLATPDIFGYLPSFLSESDPRPAREQIDERYRPGGGWFPMPGFTMLDDESLTYPSDPPLVPLAELRMRDERIVLYQHSIVAIIQPDGSFEVARID